MAQYQALGFMIMKNKALWRAVLALSHPVSIGAILLLLLNDHHLKWQIPSWWTGKLSDFAGMVFFPLVLAVPLALMIPAPRRQQENLVGWVALGLTGLVFSLVKTVPAFSAFATAFLERLFGVIVVIRLDPTDLVALPFLAVAWHLWNQQHIDSTTLRSRGWIVFGLGALASVATSPIYLNPGIACLSVHSSGTLTAQTTQEDYLLADGGEPFMSYDGGLSWERAHSTTNDPACALKSSVGTLTDPHNPEVQYKADGRIISRSEDGGATWKTDFDLSPIFQEAFIRYGNQYVQSSKNIRPTGYFTPGVKDAIIDSRTGNVIVAMGHMGVLVRTPDGKWQEITVGPYDLREPEPLQMSIGVLSGEFWLALLVVPLLVAAVTSYLNDNRQITAAVVLSWMGWLSALFVFTPGRYFKDSIALFSDRDLGVIGVLVLAICTPSSIALAVLSCLKISDQSWRAVFGVVLVAIITALLFPLPYILWSHGIITNYWNAEYIAVAIALTDSVAGYLYLRRVAGVKRKKSKRNGPVEVVVLD